ncbi:unnamed protein product [Caenorhabditis auriculariae]|uniref:Receptor ligand binding region domain-containing protein n=1 Tax=Caenorhabditis auriculariae TaxID=2777116 RepID=A0A8S1GU26_9PELO|nr:unnamed protein product [Caenorhabditis auriculariae]
MSSPAVLLFLSAALVLPSARPSEFRGVTPVDPVYLVVPLPQNEIIDRARNPFHLSINKVRPVIDLALEAAYEKQIVPRDSIIVTYRDTKTSDAHGPNIAVELYVKKQMDCIIGYAYVYALAPVARMTPFWGNGIPVITPIGLTMNLDDKTEYQLMTRISSPYKLAAKAMKNLFLTQQWRQHVYMFHHPKTNPSLPVDECFMLMASVQSMVREVIEMQHNYFVFNEDSVEPRETKRAEYRKILSQSSFIGKETFKAQDVRSNELFH